MKRRSFLKALGLSPLAAQGAAESLSAHGAGIGSIAGGAGQASIAEPHQDPVRESAWRFLRNLEDREQQKSYYPERFPVHVETKKSWSPAFKSHVLEEERRASVVASRFYEMSDAELLAYAAKRGWMGLKE